jgi:RNA-directed DNA polymerase
VNQPNNEGQLSAEAGEGRAQAQENIVQSHMRPTQSGKRMSQGLRGVRQAARERKQERFTALLHHLSVGLLRDSFYALKRQASPGVDGVTWQEYEAGLEDRLIDLHSRVHRGAYQARPSRRVYIPKADGRQRPLGIAALEDKVVQQAVVTILNQIYEVDFKGFSFPARSRPTSSAGRADGGHPTETSELGARCGHSRFRYRRGRSTKDALRKIWKEIQSGSEWIVDADLRDFFGSVDHEKLLTLVAQRVADGRVLRLIKAMLKAGSYGKGQLFPSERGTPGRRSFADAQ